MHMLVSRVDFDTLIHMVSSEIDSIQIRRGVLEDAPALAALAARTFTDAFAADNRPEDLQAHLESSYGVRMRSRCSPFLVKP
jgi:hypothetical protein